MYIIDEDNSTIEMTYSIEQTFNRVMMRSQYKGQAMRLESGKSLILDKAISLSDATQVKLDIKDCYALVHEKMSAYTKNQDVPFIIEEDEVTINVAPADAWDWGHVIQLDQSIINAAVIGALWKWYELVGGDNMAKSHRNMFDVALQNVKSILEKRTSAPKKGYNIF